MLIEVLFKSPYIHSGFCFFQFLHLWATVMCPWKSSVPGMGFSGHWGGQGVVDAVCIQGAVGMEGCCECASDLPGS